MNNTNKKVTLDEGKVKSIVEDITRHALEKFFGEGYKKGTEDTINNLKSALSDGLRYGSPECGRAMRKLRKS